MGITNFDKDLPENFFKLITTIDIANGLQHKHFKNYFGTLNVGIQYDLNSTASRTINLSELQQNSTLVFNGKITQNTTFTCATAITKLFRIILNAAPSQYTITIVVGSNSIVLNQFNEDTYIAFTAPSDLDPTNNPAGTTYAPYNALYDALSNITLANKISGGTNDGLQWLHFVNYFATIGVNLAAVGAGADLTISQAQLQNNSRITLTGTLTANISVKNLSVDITKIYRLDLSALNFNGHTVTFRTKNWTSAAYSAQGIYYLAFTDQQAEDFSDLTPTSIGEGVTYTAVIGDEKKGIISTANTTPGTLTLPANIFPVGTKIPFNQTGAQQLLVQGDGTSTVQQADGKYHTRAQYAGGFAWQTTLNVWIINGDMN